MVRNESKWIIIAIDRVFTYEEYVISARAFRHYCRRSPVEEVGSGPLSDEDDIRGTMKKQFGYH